MALNPTNKVARVNKKTGKIDNSENINTYFELILDENLEN